MSLDAFAKDGIIGKNFHVLSNPWIYHKVVPRNSLKIRDSVLSNYMNHKYIYVFEQMQLYIHVIINTSKLEKHNLNISM